MYYAQPIIFTPQEYVYFYNTENARIIQQRNEEYNEQIRRAKADRYRKQITANKVNSLKESLQKEEKRKQSIRDKINTTPLTRSEINKRHSEKKIHERWINWVYYIKTNKQMKIFQNECKRIQSLL